MYTFQMRKRGADGLPGAFPTKVVHGSYSRTKMEIRGHWHLSGPQSVATEGGCPEWVNNLFENRPELKRVALDFGENGGVVYTRMDEHAPKDGQDAQG